MAEMTVCVTAIHLPAKSHSNVRGSCKNYAQPGEFGLCLLRVPDTRLRLASILELSENPEKTYQ